MYNVDRFYVTGSRVHGANNGKAVAEFNFHQDPHSSFVVFNFSREHRIVSLPWETVLSAAIPKARNTSSRYKLSRTERRIIIKTVVHHPREIILALESSKLLRILTILHLMFIRIFYFFHILISLFINAFI